MNAITRLVRPVTADATESTVGSKVFYAAGLIVFVLGVLKMAKLGLSEVQLVFGVLLVVGVAMQMMIAGVVLDIRGRLAARPDEHG
jgi:uncharacterized membrane protein